MGGVIPVPLSELAGARDTEHTSFIYPGPQHGPEQNITIETINKHILQTKICNKQTRDVLTFQMLSSVLVKFFQRIFISSLPLSGVFAEPLIESRARNSP